MQWPDVENVGEKFLGDDSNIFVFTENPITDAVKKSAQDTDNTCKPDYRFSTLDEKYGEG